MLLSPLNGRTPTTITPSTLVSDIVRLNPATIKVFQRHEIEFCCAGKVPLGEVCRQHALDEGAMLAEIGEALVRPDAPGNWTSAPVGAVAAYVARRFHQPLPEELARLSRMADKVVQRHGERLPETLMPLHYTFRRLQSILLSHTAAQEAGLLSDLAASDLSGLHEPSRLDRAAEAARRELADGVDAVSDLDALTQAYTPPVDACPTFRGLYFGLSELDRETRLHRQFECDVLFPKVRALIARPSPAR